MSPERIDRLQTNWMALLASYGVSPPDGYLEFDTLVAHYQGDDRHYHDLEHISEVLRVVGRFADRADDLRAIQLAVLFHDAVYDSRAKDNEERSAELANAMLPTLWVPTDTVAKVAALIRATAHTDAGEVDTDTAILLDADLAILGAEPRRYDRYAEAIRREYAWVPDADYRAGRKRVLESFLARPRIFRTELLFREGEAAARANLSREVESLGGANPPGPGAHPTDTPT
jgi:predicted metal-dependent HD superfamily phosphohydrolase